jgi:hypothetical protein
MMTQGRSKDWTISIAKLVFPEPEDPAIPMMLMSAHGGEYRAFCGRSAASAACWAEARIERFLRSVPFDILSADYPSPLPGQVLVGRSELALHSWSEADDWVS